MEKQIVFLLHVFSLFNDFVSDANYVAQSNVC
jgi:hypothetical protein